MPKRSNAFQTLVAQIQHHFGRKADFRVEESKLLTNLETGEQREVDVVVEGTYANVDVIISFEAPP